MKLSSIKYSIPAMLLLGATYVNATSVKDVVQHTIAKNPEIMSILKNSEAYQYYVDEEEGGYYPKLDLTLYGGLKKIKEDPDASSKTDTDYAGYNAKLDLEQLLYDGGLTPSLVEEAKRKYSSIELKNKNRVEIIMYESISSYLSMVQADEMQLLATENIRIHDEYMVTAKETEEISGEGLQRIQVSSKLHFAKNRLLSEKKNKQEALSNFIKSVGMEPEGFICRPNINTRLIPKDKQEIIQLALKNNLEILEQIENIEQQRAVLNQAKSKYLPTIKFKAQAIYDDDLSSNDQKTNTYSGRVELTYNLFNGTTDSATQSKQAKFLQEAQKTLDNVSSTVVESVSVAYDKYQISNEQIKELKLYISDNQEILSIYQDQFEGGTRKFIDVMNAESDIYNAKVSLVTAEYEVLDAYYEMFSVLSNLNRTVQMSNDYVCKEMKIMTKEKVKKEESIEELNDLLEETPKKTEVQTPAPVKVAVVEPVKVEVAVSEPVKEAVLVSGLNEAMLEEFKQEINNNTVTYDTNTMTLKLNESYLKISKSGVVMTPDYKEVIRSVFPRYVNVAKNYSNKISEVRVEGHSSSRYEGAEALDKKFEMNKLVSLNRAKLVLGYGSKLGTEVVSDNSNFIKDTFKPYGMSSKFTVKNADGTENELLSKRVEFVVIPK